MERADLNITGNEEKRFSGPGWKRIRGRAEKS
jgi:hypothetical protein